MPKAKLFKIRSIDTFANVFQNPDFSNPVLINHEGKELALKGKWRKEVFHNHHPLVLELACGKGDYAMALAEKFPKKNFIGIDAKGARLFSGAKKALEEKRSNVVFVRMRIENITNFFVEGEADEIWITFPDPFEPRKDAKRRLTAPSFIEDYRHIAKRGAVVHLKTDNLQLSRYSEQTAEECGCKILYYKEDIYGSPLDFDELNIQTYYEKSHLAEGRTINYLQFRL